MSRIHWTSGPPKQLNPRSKAESPVHTVPSPVVETEAPCGHFASETTTYSITNVGGAPLDWTVAASETWLSAMPAGGSLAPGASAILDVWINNNAAALPFGQHVNGLIFTNSVSGASIERDIELVIDSMPAPPGTWVMRRVPLQRQ